MIALFCLIPIVIWIIIILDNTKDSRKNFKRDYIDNSPPGPAVARDPYWTPKPRDEKPEWVIERENDWDDYCEDHYFDILNECWVKEYPSGDCVKSCSFEDLQEGRSDDQGPIDIGYLVPANEYEDDPEWLERKKRHWSQWAGLFRDDPP